MKIQIAFTDRPITPPALEPGSREIGASLEFSGIVRELENGGKIAGLTYEAYEPMARKKLQEILAQLAVKYPCEAVEFTHRLGFVPVGEASLFIRVLSRHRQAALGLMAELIDRLKADVPIWKQAGSSSGS